MSDMFLLEVFKWYLIVGLVSFVVLYALYIVVMLMKPYKNTMPNYIKYPAYTIFGIGFLGDVLWNILYGTVLFWEKPDFAGARTDFKGIPLPTLTERLRDIIKQESDCDSLSLRLRMAKLVCHKLLNPWDKDHCS